MWNMTTISNNTRIREGHNTFSNIITSVGGNVTVKGDELWTAPADGNEVKKGDQWLHVTEPAIGWMAYKHKGQMICMDLKEISVDPAPGIPYSVEFVLSDLGMIDAIKIKGPDNPSINILYNEEVIAGL